MGTDLKKSGTEKVKHGVELLVPHNKIYLDEEVREEYPFTNVSENDTAIDFRKLTIKPFCYHCGDYNLSYGQKYYWHRCKIFAHFFCYYCFDYSLKKYTHTCIEGEPIVDECRTLEHMLCGKLKFYCKWDKCGKIFSASNLKRHELSCDKQSHLECPVQGCKWSGRLDEMESSHFKDHENCKMILRNVVIKLATGKTYYLLILGKFVQVKYDVEELGEVYQHDFTISLANDASDDVKPVGLVSTNQTLLKTITGDDSVKSLRKNVNLFVYFDDIKKE